MGWTLLQPVDIIRVVNPAIALVLALGTPFSVGDASLLSSGSPERLRHVFHKARKGDPITVAVIGGSITQGAAASSVDKRYGERVGEWFATHIPQSKITFVNAGIGATGSYYGALRASRDLLSKEPDFVLIDFGVNDPNEAFSAETLEGVVRQTMNSPRKPAVMLIFFMWKGGNNAQEWLGKVGRHYSLPMVSFRDALWPQIEAGKLAWSDVIADDVHPNDRGHELAAEFTTRYLGSVLRDLPTGDVRVDGRLPAPLISDRFEYPTLTEAKGFRPDRNMGWKLSEDRRSWNASEPGSVLETEVEGTHVALLSHRTRGPMGRVRVQVDDAAPVIVEGWFKETWGGYTVTTPVADRLSKGKHRVRIELLSDHAEESTGTQFQVFGLGTVR